MDGHVEAYDEMGCSSESSKVLRCRLQDLGFMVRIQA